MNNLTEFQNNLILDLQKEFLRLNPPKVESSGRFSLAAVKQDIANVNEFRDSILSYNRIIAKQLRQSFLEQIKKFNNEFSPVKLSYDKELSDFFDNEHYLKKPDCAEIGLKLSYDDHYQLYALYNFEKVEIKTTCDTIQMRKITGLKWNRLGWIKRDETIGYPTLDEYLQNTTQFQQNITAKYKHLTQ